ncbi:MAG TPA: N-acetylmuramoyl-L-alanine amidase [Clostridia bacterium]|nr:MAG: N-acetylmuramoyl-L-alanine amidase AmiA precursor [Firmicutes bacterium ADurb.Bin146]HOD93692.1 N-acetylmuramoyl-L-alanine amidase [Clostridia bacterium]
MKNILKTLIILLLLIIPFSVYAQQDIYSECEYKIFDNNKYYKLSSIAGIHKLTLKWNDTEKSVTVTYNEKTIIFNTERDIVYINNEKYYFGDIVLFQGFTYVPENITTIFNEGYTAYKLIDNRNIKYINGKITRVDVNGDILNIYTLKRYEFNQLPYFCIDEFADLYNIIPVKSVDNDYIMISRNDNEMYFYVQTDYIGYNGSYFTSGDIILSEGKFYAPETLMQYMLDVYLPDFTDNKDSIQTKSENSKYTPYIFDNSNKIYVSMKEVCSLNEYKYQWYYVNKYAEVKTDTAIYYILVPTSIIMNDNKIYKYQVKEENDIVYVEYDALNIFGLSEVEQSSEQGTSQEIQASDENSLDNKDTVSEYIPLRQFAQIEGGSVIWDDEIFSAILTIKDIKYVFDIRNMKLRINDIEISEYDFKFENGITLVNTSLEQLIHSSSIAYKSIDAYDVLILKSEDIQIKTHYILSNPDRIVLDLLNVEKLNTISYKGNYFDSVRIINDGLLKRLVIDLKNKAMYEIKKYDGYVEIWISLADTKQQDTQTENQNNQTVTLISNEVKAKILKDQVLINADNYEGYEIKRKSDPNRIILFIPNSYCNSEEFFPVEGSKYIKAVRITYDESGTYLSIELSNQCRYELLEKSRTELQLDIFSQKISNMFYYNSSNRKYIHINGISLADQYGEVNRNVKIAENDLIKEISFLDTSYRLTAGVLYINDEYIEKIQIKRSDEQVIMIIFSKQPLLLYFNSARSTYTNINLLPVNNIYLGSVVIDAGHGGFDPGAVSGSVYESKINLSVAKKVEKILCDKGIKVFMTRNTDEYVGLYERAHIANKIQASLFISIHSNAFANSNLKGIMTLVYPSSDQSNNSSGKTLGMKIHKNLISKTDAIDRGIIDRPNLVVLNSTKMPAALVECGFMTNPDELYLLQTDEYQNILAQGIAQGIIDMLDEN